MTSIDKVAEKIRVLLLDGWHDLHAAAMFLTRVPLPAGGKQRPLAKSARAFPIVGAGVGLAAGGGLLGGFMLGLHPLACAFIGITVSVLVTGALHEDAIADVADGFGGGKTASDKLRIMRDSRLGTYGAIAVFISIGLRASTLSGMITPWVAAAALIVAGAVSRAFVVVVMVQLDAARKDGLSATAGRPDTNAMFTAIALAAVLAFALLGFGGGLAAVVAAGVAAFAVAWFAKRQIGGHTGDVLGTVQQIAEIAVLLSTAAVL